jgi:hypothetical protein
MAYSTDGINWTEVANTTFVSILPPGPDVTATPTVIRTITYGDGKFIVGGTTYDYGAEQAGCHMAYSEDGINWTAIEQNVFEYGKLGTYASYYVSSITYGDGKFIAGARFGTMAYSTDGINWTKIDNHPFSESWKTIHGIAYGNGKYVAVGQSSKMAYSTDGVNWAGIAGTANPFLNDSSSDIAQITYANGKFITSGQYSGMAQSTDGVNWTHVDTHPIFGHGLGNDVIFGMAYGAGKFVGVGTAQETAGKIDPVIAYCND